MISNSVFDADLKKKTVPVHLDAYSRSYGHFTKNLAKSG